ncbi:MAG: DUF975 family protein [Mediterranea sp.]|jgi:uncharacterized membrane protein|nr:DUF975 family protein [Mediterranea sp.]
MKRFSQLKDQAVLSLEGKWLKSALITLVMIVIGSIISFIQNYDSETVRIGGKLFVTIYNPLWLSLASILYLFILTLLDYGFDILMLEVKRGSKPLFATLISGFKDYLRIWGTLFIRGLYVLLWLLLLIIPGIVKSYSYAMTPYVLKERPDLKYDGAIELSMQMMRGQKMRLFLLDLSFIGWVLLCILTLGIGFFFLIPYFSTTRAAFYDNLKEELGMTVIVEEEIIVTEN